MTTISEVFKASSCTIFLLQDIIEENRGCIIAVLSLLRPSYHSHEISYHWPTPSCGTCRRRDPSVIIVMRCRWWPRMVMRRSAWSNGSCCCGLASAASYRIVSWATRSHQMVRRMLLVMIILGSRRGMMIVGRVVLLLRRIVVLAISAEVVQKRHLSVGMHLLLLIVRSLMIADNGWPMMVDWSVCCSRTIATIVLVMAMMVVIVHHRGLWGIPQGEVLVLCSCSSMLVLLMLLMVTDTVLASRMIWVELIGWCCDMLPICSGILVWAIADLVLN